jgi:2-hydroxy-4-(methylsulfanyl)butanoate S-methyltransferase
MKPIEDVREISALTYGFIASKAMFAAVELDLFTKIAGGADTLPGIADATGTLRQSEERDDPDPRSVRHRLIFKLSRALK